MKRLLALFLALLLMLGVAPGLGAEQTISLLASDYPVEASGWYDTMEEVSVYIAAYQHLPGNYITKSQAQQLGWVSNKGNLWQVAPGKSIGGDRFGNYEGLLPSAKGRTWTECDIGFDGGYRNGLRVIYSSDGLIYYTSDHYASFRQVQVSFAAPEPTPVVVTEEGHYTSKDEVARYIYDFWWLPENYLTKAEARALGWSSSKDNLGEVAPGCAIGGDEFQNREGLLPATATRTWYECDVNVIDGHRGKERLVFSSDGLIYYTNDGYQSFEELY